MAETINIGEIAVKISEDIFSHFFWEKNKKHDQNFDCVNSDHKAKSGKEDKKTHPGDVLFSYDDPYLDKRIYLHTDLKSYKKDSINTAKLRDAFKSLCLTIECANESDSWRSIYSVDASEKHEVRGMLFVHNYDHEYKKNFYDAIERIDLINGLPLPKNKIIHFLGPKDIQRLYSIVNDMIRLRFEKKLPDEYTFYYPDQVLFRRQSDVWGQPATIESMTGPYLIIKHGPDKFGSQGYVIYYNRPGKTVEEFEYFIDSLSRFQMLDSDEVVKIRVVHDEPADELKTVFETAKKKYCKAWGLLESRKEILDAIQIERVTCVTDTYNPGDMGWRG